MPQSSALKTIFPMGAEKVSHFERWGLHHIWQDIPGGGVGRHLQVVLPASLVKNELEGLHSTLVGEHMVTAKTLEMPNFTAQVKEMTWTCGVGTSRVSQGLSENQLSSDAPTASCNGYPASTT